MKSMYITLVCGIALCIVFFITAIISYHRDKTLSLFNKIVIGVSIPWVCTSTGVIISNKAISDVQIILIIVICILNILALNFLTRWKKRQEMALVDRVAYITIPIIVVAIIVWIILIN